MSDKTPLERDLEQHERLKVPPSMYIIVILLLISIGAIGVYTFSLQQALLQKDADIARLKDEFRKEKADLANRIKTLEKKIKEASE